MSKKRASDVPLHKLDDKNTMRDESGDMDPRESEDDGRFGPPVEAGYGIKKADAATLAKRRIVKGRRQNMVEVVLEGEGKLGLVFVRDSEPPEVKSISDAGLAAKVRLTAVTAPVPVPMPSVLGASGYTQNRGGNDFVPGRRHRSGGPQLWCVSKASVFFPRILNSLSTLLYCRRRNRADQESRAARSPGVQAPTADNEGAFRDRCRKCCCTVQIWAAIWGSVVHQRGGWNLLLRYCQNSNGQLGILITGCLHIWCYESSNIASGGTCKACDI